MLPSRFVFLLCVDSLDLLLIAFFAFRLLRSCLICFHLLRRDRSHLLLAFSASFLPLGSCASHQLLAFFVSFVLFASFPSLLLVSVAYFLLLVFFARFVLLNFFFFPLFVASPVFHWPPAFFPICLPRPFFTFRLPFVAFVFLLLIQFVPSLLVHGCFLCLSLKSAACGRCFSSAAFFLGFSSAPFSLSSLLFFFSKEIFLNRPQTVNDTNKNARLQV